METPVQIDFHGIDVSPAIRGILENHIQELETRFGRITSGRVVVTGPGHKHRHGGLYDVRVRLSLPDGKQVAVDHLSQSDERYADIHFAINDTFKRARRQLQDSVGKLQGKTKHHDQQSTGSIIRIDESGEFGFIGTADGQEIYFHRNSVLNEEFDQLETGTHVSFVEEVGMKGPQASTVRVLEKHSMR